MMPIVVPAPVPGDPGAMRVLAARLRAIAASTTEAAARVQTSVAAMDFRGPAAGRLRAAVGGWSGQIDRDASELHDLSDLLMRSAAEVEAAQAERARLERLAAEEAAQAAKAAHG